MRVPSACLTVSMCICRCGPKHKWKATARVFDYRFSQVECLKRYVAPRAIEADIFEISVCEPVVRRSGAVPFFSTSKNPFPTASSSASAAASTFAPPLLGKFPPPSADVSAPGPAVGEFMAIPGCIVPGELRSSSIPRESPRKPNPERKGSKPAEMKNSGKAGSKKQT